jgi:hypothetical protein
MMLRAWNCGHHTAGIILRASYGGRDAAGVELRTSYGGHHTAGVILRAPYGGLLVGFSFTAAEFLLTDELQEHFLDQVALTDEGKHRGSG